VYTTRNDLRFDCGWRGVRSSVLLILAFIFPLLTLLTACHSDQGIAETRSALTSERWSKELGAGLLRESYVYTFHSNGTYSVCVFSDYGARPIRGSWRLTNVQGQIHLLLQNEEAYYFCLWRDSLLRYDKERDVLVLSGPHYTNQLDLQHIKGKPRDAGNRNRALKQSLQPPPACNARSSW
jgi:hypothetical protein